MTPEQEERWLSEPDDESQAKATAGCVITCAAVAALAIAGGWLLTRMLTHGGW